MDKDQSREFDSMFGLWKEYEKITMHFNTLIIQLRTRAIGGIAIIAAISGFIMKGDAPSNVTWGLLFAVSIVLCFAWAAIWVLDIKYYHKLLAGSVEALLELENEIKANKAQLGLEKYSGIQLSSKIESLFTKTTGDGNKKRSDSTSTFYILVFIPLLAFAITSFIYVASGISS